MIPYVEIRDKDNLNTLAIVEPQECWFELSYQDVGEFEVYCRASKANINALQKGRYVTLPNKRFVWVITSIQYAFTAGGARMISAKGYEAKWLLRKRCILTPVVIDGYITSALYGLVNSALGTTANKARQIDIFTVDTNEIKKDIYSRQCPRENLLEYTNQVLKSYECGATVELSNGKLKYRIFEGNEKTTSVKFTQSLDNLLTSEFLTDDADKATSALVVSTVETEQSDGTAKDVEYIKVCDTGETGIDRAEIVIESKLSTKYQDANGNELETTPDSALYQGWLEQEGNTELAQHITIEEINGTLDIENSKYIFDVDFFIGDTVRMQDEHFNFYTNTKIKKYTFKQDANGYGEEAEYGG